jgi:pullulanase/glycogen debranching enzyme
MICAGDEHGRTQRGDNNPYSGDNENFWIDWNLDDKQLGLLDFTKKLIRVRKEHPVFRHKKYFGEVRPGIKQAIFYDTAGNELNVFNWQQPSINSFSLLLRGDAIEVAPKPDTKETVLRIAGRSFVLLCKKRVEAKPVETLPMETKHPPLKLRKRLSPKPMSLRKAAPVRSVKPSVQKRKKKAGERRTNKTVPVKKHGKRTLAKKVASAKMLKNRRSHI